MFASLVAGALPAPIGTGPRGRRPLRYARGVRPWRHGFVALLLIAVAALGCGVAAAVAFGET